MPLDATRLGQDFLSVFKSRPPSPEEAARRLAEAYYTYASSALSLGASVVIPVSAKELLEKTLLLAIKTPAAGAPPVIAAAWASGHTAFWSAPPVPLLGPGITGVTAPSPASPALVPILTTLFLNPLNTEEIAGVGLAAALHTATLAVPTALVIAGTPTAGTLL